MPTGTFAIVLPSTAAVAAAGKLETDFLLPRWSLALEALAFKTEIRRAGFHTFKYKHKPSGVGLGVASFLGGVGIGAGAASKKTQINFLNKCHTIKCSGQISPLQQFFNGLTDGQVNFANLIG